MNNGRFGNDGVSPKDVHDEVEPKMRGRVTDIVYPPIFSEEVQEEITKTSRDYLLQAKANFNRFMLKLTTQRHPAKLLVPFATRVRPHAEVISTDSGVPEVSLLRIREMIKTDLNTDFFNDDMRGKSMLKNFVRRKDHLGDLTINDAVRGLYSAMYRRKMSAVNLEYTLSQFGKIAKAFPNLKMLMFINIMEDEFINKEEVINE